MGNRRMISKKTISTNQFLSLPDKSKVLYFMLILNADDDGFISDVNGIMNHFHAKKHHLKDLIDSNFIISFPSGVVLITHWKEHNLIRRDRYRETDFVDEKSMIYTDEKNCYHLIDGKPLVDNPHPQVKSKEKISKVSEDVIRPLRDAELTTEAALSGIPDLSEIPEPSDGEAPDDGSVPSEEKQIQCIHGKLGLGVVFLTDQQISVLLEKMGWEGFSRYVNRLAEYITHKGFYVKNHYETILRWYLQDTSV